MVNKKSIWFLTLFSLILVLSVYYITMPNELLLPAQNNEKEETPKKTNTDNAVVESSILVALRVELEESYIEELEILKNVLTDTKTTIEEKNNAFEQMKNLNNLKSEQEILEKKIKDEFKVQAFIKIDADQIRVVVDKKEHDASLANKIMRSIQSNYTNPMYISVKFASS